MFDDAYNDLTSNTKNMNYIVLLLFSAAVLVSDWMFGLVAISEVIIAVLLLMIIYNNFNYLKTINYKFVILILFYFLIQFSYNMSVDMVFVFRRALFNVVKVIFYFVFINILYNYIKKNELEEKLLISLNLIALISIVIGIYITIAILYFEHLPYEFLWTFTRTDLHSYRFRGPGFIVRTRSVFSEPAHLGYFLNIVLSFNLFSKYRQNISYWLNAILIVGIIVTFSYASIGVLMLIILIKLFLTKNKLKYFRKNSTKIIIAFLMAGIILFIFRDYVYHTVVLRTIEILSGGDGSALTRIVNSWSYISADTFLLGRGLGHTPPLQNIYAYFLSDMGIFPFVLSVFFTIKLIKNNIGIGLSFLLLNFQKGGYLSPIFSIFVLCTLIFTYDQNVMISILNKRKE